jgi:hypothetical protein
MEADYLDTSLWLWRVYSRVRLLACCLPDLVFLLVLWSEDDVIYSSICFLDVFFTDLPVCMIHTDL